MIAGKMTIAQKKELLDKFYEQNKDNPNIDELMENMKNMLDYKDGS